MGAAVMKWLQRLLIYADVFLCAALLGDPDMTISARCGLALRAGRPRALCWIARALNWAFPGHTDSAISSDVRRAIHALQRLCRD